MWNYTMTRVLSPGLVGYSYFSLVGTPSLRTTLRSHPFRDLEGCAQSPSSQHFICSDVAEVGRDPSEYNGNQGIHA